MNAVTDDEGGATPVLRVVKGDPTPEELGALVAVVAALGGGPAGAGRPSYAGLERARTAAAPGAAPRPRRMAQLRPSVGVGRRARSDRLTWSHG